MHSCSEHCKHYIDSNVLKLESLNKIAKEIFVEVSTSEYWSKNCKVKVIDPDGWDRQNYQFSWYEEVSMRVHIYNMKILLLTLIFAKNYIEIPFTPRIGLTLSVKGSIDYKENELKDHLKSKFAITYKF